LHTLVQADVKILKSGLIDSIGPNSISEGKSMMYLLATFGIMLTVVALMAIGVMFGRKAIKGSCGGLNSSNCACAEKCDKRKKLEAEMHS
jgi:uncharacterized protein